MARAGVEKEMSQRSLIGRGLMFVAQVSRILEFLREKILDAVHRLPRFHPFAQLEFRRNLRQGRFALVMSATILERRRRIKCRAASEKCVVDNEPRDRKS